MALTGAGSSAHVQRRTEQAEHLARTGQTDAAAELFRQLLAEDAGHWRAASFLALQALAHGDTAAALSLISQAWESQPGSALVAANRGRILMACGDKGGAIAALEDALALDPQFLPARLDVAQLLEAKGESQAANDHYRSALAQANGVQGLPPVLLSGLHHARESVQREDRALEAMLLQALAPLQAGKTAQETDRFRECFEIMMGRQRPQLPKAGFLYFPGLPALDFHPRELFPWAEALEARTDEIRAELLALLDEDEGRFIPYVQKELPSGGGASPWGALNHSTDWGVYFLHNQGEAVERNLMRCPATADALSRVPMVHIPGRGPSAFFSRLKPGAHIPPHHGATNTRLVAHLPLVVPPNCGLRVGNRTIQWRPGEVVVFDDTLEHEAWNRSNETRVVLIFDVWNPLLTAAERDMVAAVTAGYARFFPGKLHKVD